MPNTLTGLFQELVLPATARLQSPLELEKSMLKSIYVQQQPLPGTIGKTIDVNIPAVRPNDVVDIGNGAIQLANATHTTVPLVVNKNLSTSLALPEFDSLLTPVDLLTFYLQPAIEAVAQKVNAAICGLVTAANFNVHSSITAGADVFGRNHLGTAWSNLRSVGVPNDMQNQFFITSNVPYSNMIGDDTQKWISQSIVGTTAAELAQQQARLAPAFSAQIAFDQQFPQPTVGSTYAGLFFHRHAIALVPVVPSTKPKPNVEETFYQPPGSGLTFRIQVWYSPDDQAWILHVHTVFALAVVRPSFGSYLVTT